MSATISIRPITYIVVIDGLPDPFTWQDLKDFVRPVAEHQVWTDTPASPNGAPRRLGIVRTQRQKEAYNVYKFLAREALNGRTFAPILWDISQSPPKMLAPVQPQSHQNHRPGLPTNWAFIQQAYPSVPPAQTTMYAGIGAPRQARNGMLHQPAPAYSTTQQYMPQQQSAMTSATLRQPQVTRPSTTAQNQQALGATQHSGSAGQHQTSMYITNGTGRPVNQSNGVAITVPRGIFVSGISYNVTESQIKRKFSKVGTVVECALRTDNATGKSKGVATVLFQTAKEAQEATKRYHESMWEGKEIKVRLDKEQTVVAPPRPDPLIVNGSRDH